MERLQLRAEGRHRPHRLVGHGPGTSPASRRSRLRLRRGSRTHGHDPSFVDQLTRCSRPHARR